MDTPFAAKGSPTKPRNRPKPMGLGFRDKAIDTSLALARHRDTLVPGAPSARLDIKN